MAKTYRKEKSGDTWHFCTNCSNWPTADFEEQQGKPRDNLCSECLLLGKPCKPGDPSAGLKPDPKAMDALCELWDTYRANRSLSVYLDESDLGSKSIAPGAFYNGPYASVQLREPLSRATLELHNHIGNWNNENFIIRLWAILDSHGFKGTKDTRPEEIQLLYDLRCHFAHGRNQDEKERRKLRCCLICLFENLENTPIDCIPLDIDNVLEPMLQRCEEYIQDVLGRQSPDGAPGHEPSQQGH